MLIGLLLLPECQSTQGYTEEEVTFTNPADGTMLAGTFTRPVNTDVFPSVVLISGSGPQDRDETVYGHKPFKVLAEFLSEKGIGVLRFDDRGVGGSKGDVWNATLEILSSDAYAGIQYLKKRSDVNPDHIGVIGHSIGAMQGTILTSTHEDISFLVMLGGPGLPWTENSIRSDSLINTLNGSPPEVVKAGMALLGSLYGAIIDFPDNQDYSTSTDIVIQIIRHWQSTLTGTAKEEMDAFTAAQPDFWREQIAEEFATPLFISCVKFDPFHYLSRTVCPVLSIIGEKDVQVVPENNRAIENALKAGGNRQYKTLIPKNINHLMQKCETGLISEYERIDEDFNPEVMNIIAEWILTL
jgi:pimeloyl-ACP methyl ester carboxylesterase